MSVLSCPRCGTEVDEGTLFCPSCLAPLPHTPQSQQILDTSTTSDNSSVSPSATQKSDIFIPEEPPITPTSDNITLSSDTPSPQTSSKNVPRWIFPPVTVLLVLLLASAGGVWWFSQSAQSLFLSYVNALEHGDYARANSLSVASQRASVQVKPAQAPKNMHLQMQGKVTASVSYTLNGHTVTRTIQAQRQGLSSWVISRGLVSATRISGASKTVRVQGHHVKLSGKKTVFVPVPGIQSGARVYKRTATVVLYPGAYGLEVPESDWADSFSTRLVSGQNTKFLTPHVKTSVIQQLSSSLNNTVHTCMTSTALVQQGCSFANPDTSSLNPRPDKLDRQLAGNVDLYAVDFESHAFTTSIITTNCTYSFNQNGAQVKRTVQLKGYAQGSWSTGKDSQFLITFK